MTLIGVLVVVCKLRGTLSEVHYIYKKTQMFPGILSPLFFSSVSVGTGLAFLYHWQREEFRIQEDEAT